MMMHHLQPMLETRGSPKGSIGTINEAIFSCPRDALVHPQAAKARDCSIIGLVLPEIDPPVACG